jgi:hypothetical protein
MGIRSNLNETAFATVTSDDVVPVLNAGRQRGIASLGDIFEGGPHSVTTGIAAAAAGTQAAATAMTSTINIVATVGDAGHSVRLPAAVPGRIVYLVNIAANSMQVFGAGTDTINAIATGTGVAQAAGIAACYICGTSGAWRRILSA